MWGFNGDTYVGGVIGGDIQLFGSVYPDAGPIPSSGIARINAGTSTFDPDYTLDVNKLTGSTGVWAVHMLDPNDVLAQILDPAVPTSSFSTPDDIYDSSDYFFVLINADAGTWTHQDAIPGGRDRQRAGAHRRQRPLRPGCRGRRQHRRLSGHLVGRGAKQFDVESGDLWFAQRLY